MATSSRKKKEFNEATLQSLVEPITVNVRKMIGGKPQPVEIPPGPSDSVSGRGYTHDMVRELPAFISNEWSGGGMYDCTATGSNGKQMDWEMFFHPSQVPEKTPPTLVPQPVPAAPMPAPAPVLAAPQPAHVAQPAQVTAVPGYLSQMAATYRQPQMAAAAAAVAPAHNPYGWNQPFAQPTLTPTPSTGNMSASREREERLKLEAKMERQVQAAQHEKEMGAVNQELRRIQESLGKQPAVEESAALKMAHEKINALEQQSSTQTIMQQMQAMQQQTNQLMQQMQANTDKQLEAMRRESSETQKSDPMMSMMIQQMQTAAQQGTQQMQMLMQVMQGNQQSQIEAARLSQQNQMGPREMIDLFRSANQGADQMASAYGKAWDLMANGVESILQAQGPGVHPALAMLGQGVEGGLGVAQQYLEMKQNETQSNAQARAAQAQLEAQARIRTAQVQAQAQAAAAAAAAGQTAAEPHPDGDEAQPEAVAAEDGTVGEQAEAEEEAGPSPQQIAEKEEELFGAGLPHVKKLRMSVAEGKVDPVQTASAILQAVEYFANKPEEAPPVFALFAEQRFADLVDVLIADAPYAFREQTSQLLIASVEQLQRQAGVAPMQEIAAG